MKLFIKSGSKSSGKLHTLNVLSCLSQDEMMDWSGGYGRSSGSNRNSGCEGSNHHHHTIVSNKKIYYSSTGTYAIAASAKRICCNIQGGHGYYPGKKPHPGKNDHSSTSSAFGIGANGGNNDGCRCVNNH